MTEIGFIDEENAEAWARDRIGAPRAPGVFRAASIVEDGEFVCVAVLSNFTSRNIDINFAASPRTWKLPKAFARLFNVVFGYAFSFPSVARVTGLVSMSNARCLRLIEKIGFVREGVMRDALPGADLAVYGFLPGEFRRHKMFGVNNG